ncbi:alpha/beta fold hydrolase [Oleisolibacter albus]|uniref:alpha/beta fold hydrolase n=1 Tax=Oleisolibacter albus TaxID=2171757 RepID=UPI001390520A|nr:alpha/beta fold hydrolase [Oleisolibacter albus]
MIGSQDPHQRSGRTGRQARAGRLRAALLAAGLVLAGLPAPAQTTPPPDHAAASSPRPAGTPCHVKGLSDRALCYRVPVPLDRADPAAGTLSLQVAVLPARAARPAASPLVVLPGGPGQAAGDAGPLIAQALAEVRETRDILLMDARGTGQSHPLRCRHDPDGEDGLSALGLTAAQSADHILACRAAWDLDLRRVTTPDVVEDLEAVRQALGYPALDLWGVSWGTRVALLYSKAHPAAVRSMVLDGVAPPNVRLFLEESRAADAALRAYLRACAADAGCAAAFPDLEARLEAYLAGLDSGASARTVQPVRGTTAPVPLTRDGVVQAIRAALYTPDSGVRLPYVLDRLIRGDATAFLALSMGGAGMLEETMHLGVTLGSLCREEVQRTPAADVAAADAGSFTRDSWYRAWAEACTTLPVEPLPAGYDSPATADVPVLLLSGGLDPVTPPASAEQAARHLPRARHLVAPFSGHNVTGFGCAKDLIADFVAAGSAEGLNPACLSERGLPPFQLTDMGPAP